MPPRLLSRRAGVALAGFASAAGFALKGFGGLCAYRYEMFSLRDALRRASHRAEGLANNTILAERDAARACRLGRDAHINIIADLFPELHAIAGTVADLIQSGRSRAGRGCMQRRS